MISNREQVMTVISNREQVMTVISNREQVMTVIREQAAMSRNSKIVIIFLGRKKVSSDKTSRTMKAS